ncbi:MAG: zf-HC2 domain-containing protein [Acidobacteriota bacterium]
MTCDRIEGLLSAYLEGEVSPAEKSLVEAHLAGCAGCTSLAAALRQTREALTGFPELEVSSRLLSGLYSIPQQRKKFSWTFDFLLKPALQPVFAAATIFLTLLSFYLFNPDKKYFDRSISRTVHAGYSQVEKLYAKAGSLTDRLGEYKDDVLVSLKNLNIFGGNEDQNRN